MRIATTRRISMDDASAVCASRSDVAVAWCGVASSWTVAEPVRPDDEGERAGAGSATPVIWESSCCACKSAHSSSAMPRGRPSDGARAGVGGAPFAAPRGVGVALFRESVMRAQGPAPPVSTDARPRIGARSGRGRIEEGREGQRTSQAVLAVGANVKLDALGFGERQADALGVVPAQHIPVLRVCVCV